MKIIGAEYPAFIPEDKLKKIAGLDFDGVLNTYTGWDGPENLYEPRDHVETFLQELKSRGYDIVIITARDAHEVAYWIRYHQLDQYISCVSNVKLPAEFYLDDRAIAFEGSFWSSLSKITNFKPFWRTNKKEV